MSTDDDDEQLKLLIAENQAALEPPKEEKAPMEEQEKDLEIINSFKLRSTLISSMKDTNTDTVQVPEKLSSAVQDVPKDLKVDEHMIELTELCTRLETSHTMGLASDAAKERLKKVGPNTLQIRNYRWILNVIGYFFGGLTILLWPAAILSILAYKPLGGDTPDISNLCLGIILIIIILAQGFFSLYQEWSSSKVMDSIKKMLPQTASAVRNGEECKVATVEIVPGDVIKLEVGEKVPADVRLIEIQQLKVDNSILTGESEPISCTTQYTDTNYMETKNLAFMGSSVVEGTGLGIVIATGNNTVMGKVAKLASSTTKGASTLRTQANQLVIGVAILGFIAVVTLLLYWGILLRREFPRFMSVSAVITNCIGLLVAFVPEGLPVALTLTLTVIAQRMYRENVLVKSLPTVETLGAIDFIASDKTGTLTQNKMSVAQVYSGFRLLQVKDCYRLYDENDVAIQEFVQALCICNRARYESGEQVPLQERKILGDASDTAFLQFAEQFVKTTSVRSQHTKIAEIPFNSKNKWMLNIVKPQNKDQYTLYMKGASELMINRCTTVLSEQGEEMPLIPEMKDAIVKQMEELCNDGKRVLAACRLHLNTDQYPLGYEFNTEEKNFPTEGLCFIGLAALFDPPRDDVEEAIQKCKTAGITVMMVTGDHDKTAAAIAKMIGIITRDQMYETFSLSASISAQEMNEQDATLQRPLVIRGEHVPQFNKEQWDYIFKHTEIVFARTTPEHKLIIVRECQGRKHVVAATGDGVNDAPALKQANVGVAMGEGSDVAKEAADIVLIDSRFSSVVRGIERGRLVFDNLKKLIVYLMTAGNYAEMIPIVLHAFLGLPLPLSSFLMICICMATDMAPSLTLIYEQPEGDLMKRKPYIQTGERLIDFGWFVQTFLFLGNLECIGALSCYFIYYGMYAKISPLDLFLVFDEYENNWKGISQEKLDNYLYTAQTIYFVAVVVIQCFNLMTTRTRRLSFFQQFPIGKKNTKNHALFLGITISISLALFVVYLPVFHQLFNTRPIPIEFWFWPMCFGALMFILDDIRKWLLQLITYLYNRNKTPSV